MFMIRPEYGGSVSILLISLALLGCGSEARPSLVSATDSAGVAVITSHSPAWGDSARWSLSPEPALRIGSEAGDPLYELYRVIGVRQLRDGRILVVNAGTNELRFYGPDGSWIRSVGRRGEGPGEFRQMMYSQVGADSIFVWDLALSRVSVFGDNGEYARSFLTQPFSRLTDRLEDGRLLLERMVSWSDDPKPGVQPVQVQYQLADADGALLSDLGEFERSQHLVRIVGEGAASMGFPFARRSYTAALSDGFLHGTGEHFEIREYGTSGELRRIVRLDSVPEAVGPGGMETYLTAAAAASENPDIRRILSDRLADVPLPSTRPTYSGIRVGPEGEIWLKQFSLVPGDVRSGEVPRWSVFDSSGAYLGTIALPAGFELHQVGKDFVLGVTRNELDVQVVELYSLDRGTG
jgi:hypothetical protein